MIEHDEFVNYLRRLKGVKAGRGDQTAIARTLGVTKATVSGWFSGDREPSAENYLKMALNADFVADKVWFLRRAGLASADMRDALEYIYSKEEPTVLVGPLLRRGGEIPIPRAFVPHPEASAYLRLNSPQPSTFPVRSDTIIVDSSERRGQSLRPYWDQIVLVRFRGENLALSERLVGIEVAGYRVGTLVFQPAEYREVAGKHLLECGAELVDIDGRSPGLPVAHKWVKAYDDRPRIYEFRPADRAASEEMKAHRSVTICGRVIAWFGCALRPSDVR